MLAFLASNPSRSRTAHLPEIFFDSGASILTFNRSTTSHHGYPVTNSIPPAPFGSLSQPLPHSQPNSALLPPLHWHRSQDETFHVVTGAARFLLDGKEIVVPTGSEITVPKGVIHTFGNASENDRLILEFGLSPRRKEDEMYFRNIQNYREDCRRCGMQRSWPQMLLFMRNSQIVPVIPALNALPKGFGQMIGIIWTLIGGLVIGKWILGYKESYNEYYHETTQ